MNGSEGKNLLKNDDRHEKQEEDDDWWASDSGSSEGSYYSNSDSSLAEWESDISPSGEVFYIESLPKSGEPGEKCSPDDRESPIPEFIRRRSTRAGKLLRLLKRRESKRYSTREKKSKHLLGGKQRDGHQHKEGNGNKEVTFRDCQAGEIREVTLTVDPEKRHKLGRRATLCEAYLGITPGGFSDKLRVMVAGFIPDGEAMKNKNIKIGDWLRSVNSREVTSQNLEHVLSEISTVMSVKLELQRVAGVEVTAETPTTNFPKQSSRVRQLVDKEGSRAFAESLLEKPLGLIYLRTIGLSETDPEMQGVLYTYPRSENKSKNNLLCSIRGAFVTINHMLPEITDSEPVCSTISYEDQEVNIIYIPRDGELFMMALPDYFYRIEEALELVSDVVQVLEFSYQSLTRCFENKENHFSLDHFFFLFFTRLSNENESPDSGHLSKGSRCEFETLMPAAHFIKLSRDATIQMDAALSEMEAMDYRDWNEDPMDCQRLYTILGSCLYHKSYLLASHLPDRDLAEINSFLRHNRLLNLVENEATKSLVVWRRVYPSSCNRGKDENSESLGFHRKWFLLVVGFGHELLAVLLENGGCTAEIIDAEGPEIFYVEEAQETLKHIQKIGISTMANKWVLANAIPETLDINDRKNVKQAPAVIFNWSALKPSEREAVMRPRPRMVGRNKTPQIVSILKRKISTNGGQVTTPIVPKAGPPVFFPPWRPDFVYTLPTSEDSTSQETGAASEISDEAAPILGRRATREKNLASLRHSDDSDSDVDMYRNDSQKSTIDISDIRENLLNQAEYIVPRRITSGKKPCLLHYVHLDTQEGILLSSRTIENPTKNEKIVNNFNRCAHAINKLFNNAIRFQKIIRDDTDKWINKNLIAIREQGVLFEYEDTSYWVVGRLYFELDFKKFFVCYEDSVPQNMVEIAFKLSTLWI